MAMRKGTSSSARSSSRPLATRAKSRWGSVAVSPWPGKCLPTHMMPASRKPRRASRPRAHTVSASRPKLRTPITGLSRLLLISSTGASTKLIPTLRSCRPVHRAALYTAWGSSREAVAMAEGIFPMLSGRRETMPPSSSEEIRGGVPVSSKISSRRSAHSLDSCSRSRWLYWNRITFPIFSSRTRRTNSPSSSGPGSPVTIIWPSFSVRVMSARDFMTAILLPPFRACIHSRRLRLRVQALSIPGPQGGPGRCFVIG